MEEIITDSFKGSWLAFEMIFLLVYLFHCLHYPSRCTTSSNCIGSLSTCRWRGWSRSLMKDTEVFEVDYCAYVHLQRHLSPNLLLQNTSRTMSGVSYWKRKDEFTSNCTRWILWQDLLLMMFFLMPAPRPVRYTAASFFALPFTN